MYYYKARIYSPTLGRFLQTDPIGYGDGLNWYNYVGGDPVNATDPSGLCAKDETEIDGECVIVVDVFGRPEKEVSVKGAGSVGGGRFWSGGIVRKGVGNDPVDVTVTANLRAAVVAAINDVCKCDFDDSIIVIGNRNYLKVTNPSLLPKIFVNSSTSGHSRSARETGVIASSGNGPFSMHFVLKLYVGESSLNGSTGITLTTSSFSLRHAFDAAIFYATNGNFEINPFIARQYCLVSRGC